MLGVAGACFAGDDRSRDEARGQAALRVMDCARCHGRDLTGWAAPSLVAAVRDGSRERFDHYVLEGDAVRGMPGYRSQARVVADLDAIYAYLRAHAEGRIGAGTPQRLRRGSSAALRTFDPALQDFSGVFAESELTDAEPRIARSPKESR
jgi:cytochrome c55X